MLRIVCVCSLRPRFLRLARAKGSYDWGRPSIARAAPVDGRYIRGPSKPSAAFLAVLNAATIAARGSPLRRKCRTQFCQCQVCGRVLLGVSGLISDIAQPTIRKSQTRDAGRASHPSRREGRQDRRAVAGPLVFKTDLIRTTSVTLQKGVRPRPPFGTTCDRGCCARLSISPTGSPPARGSEIAQRSKKLTIAGLRSTSPFLAVKRSLLETSAIVGATIGVVGNTSASRSERRASIAREHGSTCCQMQESTAWRFRSGPLQRGLNKRRLALQPIPELATASPVTSETSGDDVRRSARGGNSDFERTSLQGRV